MYSNFSSKLNSQLLKYKEKYESGQFPTVFAPLAEEYRKVGMLDKALKVLHKEIKLHPNYAMGHYSLAACYYELGKFHLAYETLSPWIYRDVENITMLRLYAKICTSIDNKREALKALNTLHFLCPKDKQVKIALREIMGDESRPGALGENEAYIDTLGQDDGEDKLPENWHSTKIERPQFNFTLVDLYCNQGLYHKAYEVLESMTEIDPDNFQVKKKMSEVAEGLTNEVTKKTYDFHSKEKLTDKYEHFLEKIKVRAAESKG